MEYQVRQIFKLQGLSLIVQNKIGSLNKITSCISKLNANIVDIKINKREEDFFLHGIRCSGNGFKHFNDLFVSLKLEDAIYKIEREFKINKILNIYKKTNALLEGHFILSSGLHSSIYLQSAIVLSYPKYLKMISGQKNLIQKIK